MKYKWVLLTAPVFAMSGFVPMAQAIGSIYFDELCGETVTKDTQVKKSRHFTDDCTIRVDDAKLEVHGAVVMIDGRLTIADVSGEDGNAKLVIKNAEITTSDRVEIQLAEELEDQSPPAWNGGVAFKNTRVDTGDDLRVKPTGNGDLIFKSNWGDVIGDIRLGDEGLQGDTDARNNKINVAGDFRAQSTDGDIGIRNNELENAVSNVQVVSASGDIGVKNNEFESLGTETAQEITITSVDGDVRVRINTFGESVGTVSIESTTGQCQSDRNGPPDVVDSGAC